MHYPVEPGILLGSNPLDRMWCTRYPLVLRVTDHMDLLVLYVIHTKCSDEQYLGSGGCKWEGRMEVSSVASTPPCKASSMFFFVGLLRACTQNATCIHCPSASNVTLLLLWSSPKTPFPSFTTPPFNPQCHTLSLIIT